MLFRYSLILWALLCCVSAFSINDKIYSEGSSSQETLAKFLSNGNSSLGEELVNEFAAIYIEESKLEGINWDIAFVQMCLETGFLKYGGLVEIGQNNFCGLGSFDNKQGASFLTIRDGVKAHIQHLKAYSTTEDLIGELLDPRFHLVQRGSATNVLELAGKWAEDPKYGNKLTSLLNRISFIQNRDIVLKVDISVGFESINSPTEMVVEEIKNKIIKTENLNPNLNKLENLLDVNDEIIEDGWLR